MNIINVLGKGFIKTSKFFESTGKYFETISKGLKKTEVSIHIKSTVETTNSLSGAVLLTNKTWSDLFQIKGNCKMKKTNDKNVDILIILTEKDNNIVVTIESKYINSTSKNEVMQDLKQLWNDMNKTIDDVFDRDRTIIIDGKKFLSENETEKVIYLKKIFDKKIAKVHSAVLIKKAIEKK
jgi:hypothetical protein